MSPLRFVAAITSSKKSVQKAIQTSGLLHLTCVVKPGASTNREGIVAVTDEHVELCVSARARDGEANKAVRELVAEVLGVPKSAVDIARGHKSREKVLVIDHTVPEGENPDLSSERVLKLLEKAART